MMIKRVRSHHYFMWNYLISLMKEFTRPAMVFILFLSFSIIFAGSLGIFYFESGINKNIETHLDALYYTVSITTGVGLGDIAPITSRGRILSMILMMIGTALYVSFTAIVATTILRIETSHEKE